MNTNFNEATLAVQKAREALRNNNRTEARQWAERAASLAPQMEDPWLILAAVASPRASVDYIQRALRINPNSPRARKGMEWAMQRLRESPPPQESVQSTAPVPVQKRSEGKTPSKRSLLLPILIVGLGCLVCAAAAWSATTSPAVASILSLQSQPVVLQQTHPQNFAQVSISKPTYTPQSPQQVAQLEATPTPFVPPTDLPTDIPTLIPTDAPTATLEASPSDLATSTVAPTTASGGMTLEYVPDTPTSAVPTNAPAATEAVPSQPGVASGQRWIDVNLTQQMVYAYQGDTVVNSFLVSTGTWQYPTVTGQYHIYVKLRYTDMAGPGYYLPNVPYTMYFYQGYGLHGTYWHHNFGTPMSHGCVNLSIPDAEWLYNWASVGTLVNIHY
ncbi:MAG: L,D-transpeptidase family protein [Chloroflexi bacterium]|nr:L,D-transpeptidase family protein [Chloroflexota bacterium]